MTENSDSNLRQWPNYAHRRQDGTNREESGQYEPTIDYDTNIPLNVDLRIDANQHLNALHIRTYTRDNLTGSTSRPTDHGLGYSREEFEFFQEDGEVSRLADPSNLTREMPGFTPAHVRDMFQLAHALSMGEASPFDEVLTWDGTNQLAGNNQASANAVAGSWVSLRPGTGGNSVAGVGHDGLGPWGLHANRASNWTGSGTGRIVNGTYVPPTNWVIPPKDLIQMLLTGTTNISSYQTQEILSFVSTALGAQQRSLLDDGEDRVPFGNQGGAGNVVYEAAEMQGNLNYMALNMIYTSFGDFVVDWADAIENLVLNLRYFKGEFIGFFERGFKSHFWQKLGTPELLVMCWAVQLGMAVRRGTWQQNLHPIQQYDAAGAPLDTTFAGVWNPFFFRLDNFDYDTMTVTPNTYTEMAAPGLLRYIDEILYEKHAYEDPRMGIYQEDLLTGLDIIFSEASRELGLGFRSISRGYMEFFEDVKAGKIPDLRSENARTEMTSLKTAWHCGFNNVTDVSQSLGTAPLDESLVSWWSSFVDNGGLIEIDEQDRLLRNFEDLSQMEFVTGDQFTAGMQMAGLSQTKLYHRQDMNGNEHSIDVTLDPESAIRLINFKTAFLGNGNEMIRYSADWPESAYFPKKHRIVLCFPSSNQGWHVYANNMIHPLCDIIPGEWYNDAGTGIGQIADNILGGYGRGYSHLVYPDGTLIHPDRYQSSNTPAQQVLEVDGNDHYMTPMFGEMYYDLAPDGWYPSLQKALTRTYARWQENVTVIPFQSNWKSSPLQSLNLLQMLTMSTGEAVIQNNLDSLLLSGYCGQGGADSLWHIESRLYDRELHNPTMHLRPGRRQNEFVGMDAIGMILPDGSDANRVLEGQLMLNVLMYLNAKLSDLELFDHAEDYYGRGGNSFGNANRQRTIAFYDDIYSWSVATAGRTGSNVRTIFEGQKLLDNQLLDYNITRMGLVVNPSVGANPLTRELPIIASYISTLTHANPAAGFVEMFDFYLEEIVTAWVANSTNAAHMVPGMRQWYLVYNETLNPDAIQGVANSPCSLFGLGGLSADGTGSIINNMEGYAIAPYEVITLVNRVRNALQLPERPQIANVAMWDSDLWAEYISYRRGVETADDDDIAAYPFLHTPLRVIVLDQDVYDTWTNMTAVLHFLLRRQVNTYSTAHAILDKSWNCDYTAGVNTTSAGGGVAVGSGFDDSDVPVADTETSDS